MFCKVACILGSLVGIAHYGIIVEGTEPVVVSEDIKCSERDDDYHFSHSNAITPYQDNVMGTVSVGNEILVSFDMTINSLPNDFYTSILHVGNTDSQRSPAFWLQTKSGSISLKCRLGWTLGVSITPNGYDFEVGNTYSIKLTVDKNGNVEWWIDNVIISSYHGTLAQRIDANVYIGNPWYTPAPVTLKNVVIQPCVDDDHQVFPTPEYTEECAAYGDPHILTWDQTGYHFQGEGYFDYVRSCKKDETKIPFTVTAKHVYCAKPYTCVGETLVQMNDGNIIKIPSHGQDITPRFLPSLQNAKGSYTFTDQYGQLARYTVKETQVEVFFMYNNEPAAMKIYYAHDILRVKTTDSMVDSNICGLCGDLDHNNGNDPDCRTYETYDNSDASQNLMMVGPIYEKTNKFGESCCNRDADMKYIGESDCGDLPPPATQPTIPPECYDTATGICGEVYNEYCKDCYDNFARVNQQTYFGEWMTGCVIDFCSMPKCRRKCLRSRGGLFKYNMDDAIRDGCVNDVVKECIVEKYDDFSERIEFCSYI